MVQVQAFHMMHPGLVHLAWGVRTGGDMFAHGKGMDLWTWLKQDPAKERIFNRGMAETDNAGTTCIIGILQSMFGACTRQLLQSVPPDQVQVNAFSVPGQITAHGMFD